MNEQIDISTLEQPESFGINEAVRDSSACVGYPVPNPGTVMGSMNSQVFPINLAFKEPE